MQIKLIKYGREIATGETLDLTLESKGLIALAFSHAMAMHDAPTMKDAKIQLKYMNQAVNLFMNGVEIDITDNNDKLDLFQEAYDKCMRILWKEQSLYRANKLLVAVAHGYTVILETRMKEIKKGE